MPGRSIVTLLGVRQARVGATFIHEGASPVCEGCKYAKVCIGNLEEGRAYLVTELLGRVLPCPLHEEGVMVVRVVEAPIRVAVPARVAVEGAIITLEGRDCNQPRCGAWNLCHPEVLVSGDRCKVLEVGGRVTCPLGLNLVCVVVCRVSPR